MPFDNRGLPYFILVILCITAFLGEFLRYLLIFPSMIIKISLVFVLLFMLFFREEKLEIRTHMDRMEECFKTINFSKFGNIFVDRFESPIIKYLFEHGIYKDIYSNVYPSIFHFEKAPPHSRIDAIVYNDYYSSLPKMDELVEYDLLIIPELFDDSSYQLWTEIEGCKESVFIKKDK